MAEKARKKKRSGEGVVTRIKQAARRRKAEPKAPTRAKLPRPSKPGIAVIADPHIDAKDSFRFGRTMPNPAFAYALEQISAADPRPKEVVIVGDIAHTGASADYRRYLELLDPLKVHRVRHMLGNHDNYRAFRRVVMNTHTPSWWRKRALTVHRFAWDFGRHWRLLAMDTRWLRAIGRVSKGQITWLEKQAELAGKRNVLVFMHHDPSRRGMTGVIDSKSLLAAIERHPNIRAVVFGHRHELELRRHAHRVHLICAPPTSWVFVPRRPRGWLLLTPEEQSLTVEYVPVTEKSRRDPFVKTLTWE